MTKLFVLPLMLATTAGIIGSTPVEAGPGGGGFISSPKRCTRKNPCSRMPELPAPRKRCTFKRPCSPMPELPFLPGEIQPMPRGGFPHFGTPMPRGGLRRQRDKKRVSKPRETTLNKNKECVVLCPV